MSDKPDLSGIGSFDWDKGNSDKNKKKHDVTKKECEEIFFNEPLILLDDESHSSKEQRWGALGKTDNDRLLAIYFTIRNKKIRVISARNQSKKDRKVYLLKESNEQD
jgi:uncharacterized protein